MSRYWKSIIAAALAVAITVVQVVQASTADGQWTTEDTLVTILAFLSAVAVYFKANTPPTGEVRRAEVSEAEH